MYIAIAGNSGVGKSTLLTALSNTFQERGASVTHLDEGQFHHPEIRRMFESPEEWAFPVQINFAVQRACALRRAREIDPSSVVLMERSSREDMLFFDYYVDRGILNAAQRAAYEAVTRELRAGLPEPDLVVFLGGDPVQQLSRIEADVAAGRRTAEILGEGLRKYIYAMDAIYRRWWETERSRADGIGRLELASQCSTADAVHQIVCLVDGAAPRG